MTTMAEALLRGEPGAVAAAARGLIRLARNNFVERPWGGMRIREFKRLCPLPDQAAIAGTGLGESFEVAADDADPEARRYPSRVRFEDGSCASLPHVLARQGAALLGPAFAQRYGARFPLLPKILDIRELLSVQGHPPGNTEAYVIIDADPGATIRLGFRSDIDATALVETLNRGLQAQRTLVERLHAHVPAGRLQTLLGPWFANRDAVVDAVTPQLGEWLAPSASESATVALVLELKRVYWHVLDAMNTIAVAPGQIIHNATPARLLGVGQIASAEVHALGNPERREILALEVRAPGPTFRAWDNVRFPPREVDVRAAVAAVNLRATTAEDFFVDPVPVPGRACTSVSIDSSAFRIEHLRPTRSAAAPVGPEPPHTLHVLAGDVAVESASGRGLGVLRRGESAIVAADTGPYRVHAQPSDAHVLKVSLSPVDR